MITLEQRLDRCKELGERIKPALDTGNNMQALSAAELIIMLMTSDLPFGPEFGGGRHFEEWVNSRFKALGKSEEADAE